MCCLNAKVALVTGAARRLGAEILRLLHASGYQVVLHYHHSEAEALLLAAELNAIRPESVFLLKADLLSLEQVEQLAQNAVHHWGGLDILVNNASQFYPKAFGDVDENDWSVLINSNLKAPFFLSQILAPALQQRKGCIVNIVDIHAEKGLKGYPVYSIAKAGLVAMTKCLAKELAPNVRVNAVAPGAILWPDHSVSESQKIEVLQKVALQRCGTTEDIARTVRFLIEDADYITGQILTVDGGRTLFT
jgi:pteridine reductase